MSMIGRRVFAAMCVVMFARAYASSPPPTAVPMNPRRCTRLFSGRGALRWLWRDRGNVGRILRVPERGAAALLFGEDEIAGEAGGWGVVEVLFGGVAVDFGELGGAEVVVHSAGDFDAGLEIAGDVGGDH